MSCFNTDGSKIHTFTKKGQENTLRLDNGGGRRWSEEGKQFFDFLYRMLEADRIHLAAEGGSKKDSTSYKHEWEDYEGINHAIATQESTRERVPDSKDAVIPHSSDSDDVYADEGDVGEPLFVSKICRRRHLAIWEREANEEEKGNTSHV